MFSSMARSGRAVSLLFALLASPLFAREISPDEAAVAARNWLSRSPHPLGAKIAPPSSCRPEVRAATDGEGRKLFYLVKVENGTVVTSTDDALTPVIAFTESQSIPETDENPLWAILVSGSRSRMDRLAGTSGNVRPVPRAAARPPASVEWASLLAPVPLDRLPRPLGNGLATLSDVRVAPLIQSKWHQEGARFFNGDRVLLYNYFTPNHYVCGCVATATAQIMRYHGFPRSAVSPVSRPCRVDDVVTRKTMQGGLYEWDLMDLDPPARPAADVCRAIGKLCYDVGVALSMDWTSSGSGTAGYASLYALKNVFGYANAVGYTRQDAFSDLETARVLCSNLDAGLPVLVGLEGHEVIGDGYGYRNGTLYVHLNMGWGGRCDAWYHMPDVSCDNGSFHFESATFTDVSYNISPTSTGVLLTGRVTDPSGTPLPNISVSAVIGSDVRSGRTNEKGIYALWVRPDVTYAVTASKGKTISHSRSVRVPNAVGTAYFFSEKEAIWTFRLFSGKLGNSCGNDLVLELPSEPKPVLIGGSLQPGDGEAISLAAEGFVLRFRAPEANRTYVLEATSDLLNEPFFDTGSKAMSTAIGDLIELFVSPPLPPAAFFRVVAE